MRLVRSVVPMTVSVPALPSPAPLFAAYDRLTDVYPALTVLDQDPRSGGGWVTAAELAAGGPPVDTFLTWDAAQIQRDYGQRGRPDVVASFGLHRYAWPAALLITVPWLFQRRVPRVPVERVSFHRTSGRMTVRITEFACLPGDPLAAAPGARVVPDEEALRAAVRSAAAEHLGPVLDGFRPRLRRGGRGLWGMATDEVVEGLWHIGQLTGAEQETLAAVRALLPGGTAPYVGGAGFRTLTGPAGEPLRTRDRASCCLFYTLRPAETCVTCPRTDDAERLRRMTAN